MKTATIKTKHGDIRLKLHDDKAPNTVANFEKLAKDGFYDGLTFHRVIPGFVAQGGIADTAIRQAAFTAETGTVVGPVAGTFGTTAFAAQWLELMTRS